jgi:hypothetical protein
MKEMQFIFILDKDMIAKMFFIPEKNAPELTDQYLDIVDRYFSANRMQFEFPIII